MDKVKIDVVGLLVRQCALQCHRDVLRRMVGVQDVVSLQ
uniref:Uncharacterized protein n=1 Tax=Arundo donax TaxID=35708 RepID=A0A0A9C895_ARUDO